VVAGVSGIVAWSPLVPGGRRNLTRNGLENFAALNGVSESAQVVIGQPAVSGNYFTEQDIQRRAREALIGRTVAERLFPGESPVGGVLTVDNLVFTVKGVLKELGGDPHGGDLDNVVSIPYTTLLQMNKSDQLFSVRFLVAAGSDTERAAATMRTIMRKAHNIGAGQPDDFLVTTAPGGLAAFRQFEATFIMLLPVVVGVIFLIAAGVITIISLSSVRERIAEIGLRKAVGARNRDISTQFLLETAVLSGIGGLLGILLTLPVLAYTESFFARAGSSVKFLPSPGLVVFTLLCCVLVGLAAGCLPALRAANLTPVDALR
jgi:putative ABC transport system permease protein